MSTFASYIDRHGPVCAACKRDCSTAGVAPGDGYLYCPPCHRNGAAPTVDGQLALEL